MSTKFSDLGLPETVVTSLKARGISDAFPIQTMAIPPALEGKDVCGRAPTGSGKTIAFGIPLAERVSSGKPNRPSGLVLAPTRELAAQIQEELWLLLKPYGRTVASFYGGVGMAPQQKLLRRGIDVAVACPGRLSDLVRRGDLILDDVEFVVIDEADRMADMGFLPEVKRILDAVRPDRQTLLFSATLDGDVDVLIKRYQRKPVRCEVESDKDEVDRTTHEFVDVKRDDRVDLAANLIDEHGSTVVFCRTKHGADRVARQLKRVGVSAVPIHGGRSQGQRDRALKSFSDGRAQALVATDVAARGVHVDNVGCVLHFDVAGDHKDYVHRSGRTGRAGAEGVVVSFVTREDSSKIRKLQRSLGMPTTTTAAGRVTARPRVEVSETADDRSDNGHRRNSGPKRHGSGSSKNRSGQGRKQHGNASSGQKRNGSGSSKKRSGSGSNGHASNGQSPKNGSNSQGSKKPGGGNSGQKKRGGSSHRGQGRSGQAA